ncbi:MAG: hypothetical protein V4857_26515 [Pseudomonadota bacterium]
MNDVASAANRFGAVRTIMVRWLLFALKWCVLFGASLRFGRGGVSAFSGGTASFPRGNPNCGDLLMLAWILLSFPVSLAERKVVFPCAAAPHFIQENMHGNDSRRSLENG